MRPTIAVAVFTALLFTSAFFARAKPTIDVGSHTTAHGSAVPLDRSVPTPGPTVKAISAIDLQVSSAMG